jgi:hypothetical protein
VRTPHDLLERRPAADLVELRRDVVPVSRREKLPLLRQDPVAMEVAVDAGGGLSRRFRRRDASSAIRAARSGAGIARTRARTAPSGVSVCG